MFRRFAASVMILALGAIAVPAAAGGAGLSGPIPAEVVGVVDGDTISVRAFIWLDQVVETNVRLDGIDTPELRSRCPQERELARAARELMRTLVAEGRVVLFDVQSDKYGGRVRARVTTEAGRDLALQLIDAGLARPYHGEARIPWCAPAQPG